MSVTPVKGKHSGMASPAMALRDAPLTSTARLRYCSRTYRYHDLPREDRGPSLLPGCASLRCARVGDRAYTVLLLTHPPYFTTISFAACDRPPSPSLPFRPLRSLSSLRVTCSRLRALAPSRPRALALYAGRRAAAQRLVASKTANTAARSALSRTSAVPVSNWVSRPPNPCTATNTNWRSN